MERSTLAQAIRAARLASGLTQEQLGRRLGLKGRAVYRWERDDSAPRGRHRRELVTAISAVNQAAATALATVFASEAKGRRGEPQGAPTPPPAPVPPVIDPKLTLELAVFTMADDLDVPARRLRAGLIRLVTRMREASISLDLLQRHLEEQSAEVRSKSSAGAIEIDASRPRQVTMSEELSMENSGPSSRRAANRFAGHSRAPRRVLLSGLRVGRYGPLGAG